MKNRWMKRVLTISILICVSACATRPAKERSNFANDPQVPGHLNAREPAAVKRLKYIDLGVIQAKMPSFQKLDRIFASSLKTKLHADEIPEILDQLKTDPKYSDLATAYTQETYRALGVDDPFQWMQQNPDHMGAINRYIDPQDAGEPIWATTNRKLRNSQPLSPDEDNFVNRLVAAQIELPQIVGIVFRGAKLERKDLDRYKEGQPIVEVPFTSTSIDPQIALMFAQHNTNPDRVAVIFVIKAKTGSPISAFHPGNNHEVEVLLRPGTSFTVHRTLWTQNRKSVFIFMTE